MPQIRIENELLQNILDYRPEKVVYAVKEEFKCRWAKSGPCNYAMNKNVENIGSIYTTNAPPDMVLLFETYPGWNQVGGSEILTTANNKGVGCNVLYLDHHVFFEKIQDLQELKWKPDKAQQEE